MSYTKVHWLLDGVAAKTHPNNWVELQNLSSSLVEIIGKKELQHEIVDLRGSFQRLSAKLVGLPISTIIDVSHWIGYGLEPLFPGTEIVTDFSISRVIDASARDTKTAGFIINTPKDEVRKRGQGLDLSRVLIVDDATVSGRTNGVIMETWGLDPSSVIHASLMANIGDYPTVNGRQTKRGAQVYLEGMGGRLVYGDAMVSPQDEAEHLQDVFQHSHLERVFSRVLELRTRGISLTRYTEDLIDFSSERITELDLSRLTDEGRFIRNAEHTATEESFYSRNPLLWTHEEFWGYIDENSVNERQGDVLSILKRFEILAMDPGNIFESREVLARETNRMLTGRKEREV